MKVISPFRLAAGGTLMLLALWGGAFLCHIFPPAVSDYGFAAISTAVLAGVAGFALLASSFDPL